MNMKLCTSKRSFPIKIKRLPECYCRRESPWNTTPGKMMRIKIKTLGVTAKKCNQNDKAHLQKYQGKERLEKESRSPASSPGHLTKQVFCWQATLAFCSYSTESHKINLFRDCQTWVCCQLGIAHKSQVSALTPVQPPYEHGFEKHVRDEVWATWVRDGSVETLDSLSTKCNFRNGT